MFGDKESAVNSSSTPPAKLHKSHAALLSHCIHEAVASKYVRFYFSQEPVIQLIYLASIDPMPPVGTSFSANYSNKGTLQLLKTRNTLELESIHLAVKHLH